MTEAAPRDGNGEPRLRRDAARNRRRILDAARDSLADGCPLQLNAVAQRAGVGVGTVYRHFPSTDALLESLAAQRFEELIERAQRAAVQPDALQALLGFLRDALEAYMLDGTLADAAVGPQPATDQIRVLRTRLIELTAALVERAVAAGVLRPEISAVDLMLLLCGVAHALSYTRAREDPAVGRRYLDALLNGVLLPVSPDAAAVKGVERTGKG